VLHPNQSIAGIITDGDLRRAWEKITGNSNTMLAQHIMSPNPITADHDMLAADAAKLMIEKKISQLIITGNDHYVGMVHIHDLNREGIL